MKRLEHLLFLILAGSLTLFLMLFPAITADSIAHLFSKRPGLDPGNFALIFYLELSRGITTVVALIAVLVLLVKSSGAADARALTLFLIFVALTYEKVFGGTGYPGPMQERATLWMLENGMSRATLAWIFGPVPWSIWLALAAILRFSVVFPRPPLSPGIIDASARHDRKGMMRGAGVAGTDVGAVFRGISKRLLAAGAFKPVPLWAAAIALIVATTVLGRTARITLFAVVASVVTALAITNLRASYNVVEPREKERMRWLTLGFLGAAALFLVASLPVLLVDNQIATVPALVLLMIAPAVVMICMAMSVIYEGQLDAAELLERLPEATGVAFVLLLIFTLVATALAASGADGGIVAAAAAATVLLFWKPVRALVSRAVNRVLERPAGRHLV